MSVLTLNIVIITLPGYEVSKELRSGIDQATFNQPANLPLSSKHSREKSSAKYSPKKENILLTLRERCYDIEQSVLLCERCARTVTPDW